MLLPSALAKRYISWDPIGFISLPFCYKVKHSNPAIDKIDKFFPPWLDFEYLLESCHQPLRTPPVATVDFPEFAVFPGCENILLGASLRKKYEMSVFVCDLYPVHMEAVLSVLHAFRAEVICFRL